MIRIAITGGIGSGKTAVTDYLEAKGFLIIDTDKMSHDMTAPGGKAIPYIREHFGEAFIAPDGSMDRKKMRDQVYQDPESMKVLEQGTTEVIVADTKKLIGEYEEEGAPCVFIAIPLLFETGYSASDYDTIWSVTAPKELRLERVMKRDGLPRNMVERIMDKQVSDETRAEKSDELIENAGNLEELRDRIDTLLQIYDLECKE